MTRWVGLLPRMVAWLKAAHSGQVIIWVAVMMPLFISIVGITIDGGVVFDARRELQNLADGAARAGAMQIDQQVYRESSGARMVLDPLAARRAAAEYVVARAPDASAMIGADTQQVVIEVSRDAPTAFIRIVGINTVRIKATAPAAARFGIERRGA